MNDYKMDLTVLEHDDFDKGYIRVSSDMTNFDLLDEVNKLGLYFKEELNYTFLHRPSSPFNAILFIDRADDKIETMKNKYCRIFGCCMFENKEIYQNHKQWVLEWVWIHPFFRHRGSLQKYWNGLEKQFGDFLIKEPVSCGMKEFLKKISSEYKHEEHR
jgi:hypothetical protein